MSRHARAVHLFSCQTPDPVRQARMTVDWNNPKYGAELDFGHMTIDAPGGSRWTVTWVYDTQDMTNPTPDDPWSGPPPGGEVIACWWAPYVDCPDCDNNRVIEIFHASTDAVIGHRPCPACTPKETT